jgi:hypothetical protein
MKKSLIVLFLTTQSLYAAATDQSNCEAAAGSYLTGIVTTAPKFASASETLKGVKLSHTHVTVKSDQDGQLYDVAMDNVYAVDYVKNSNAIPKSLAAIKINDHLELCGQLYTSGGLGIHWVHDNCNQPPTGSAPNGWTEELAANGTAGVNLERSQTYCYLWGE